MQIAEYSAGAPVETAWLWGSVAGMAQEKTAGHVRTICARLRPLLAAIPATAGGADTREEPAWAG